MSERVAARVRRVALIGNSPPRLCGLSTFTSHLREGLVAAYPDLAVDLYAMNDRAEGYAYPPEVVGTIGQNSLPDYAAAAHQINASGADIVCVQHEYGIFGGPAGAHLIKLLDRVTAPVVVTLHTVLEDPTPEQRAVLEALVARADRLVVMAEKGRAILMRSMKVAANRIAVIPHGTPDRPLSDGTAEKARFGLTARQVLLTFGLLSPNKGIETIIRALPAIVERHPQALYVVLGATHPHLVAHEGEAYREGLKALAEELGVSAHVRFEDGYVEQERLLDWLAAADLYVTPYLNPTQITSGTLAYAVALGRPVVSTPYWHAEELLSPDIGLLVPFGDSTGFAHAIGGLLADPARMTAMRERAWARGRATTWPATGRAYGALFENPLSARPERLRLAHRPARPPEPRLDAIERLTDGCGIVQHGIYAVPDRNHGYCLDDNARALMLMHRFGGAEAARADRLAMTYAGFVHHAWNGERGRFRNFMGYDRSWLEREGSEDSFGRAVWCLGATVAEARRHDLRRWAAHLFDQVAPHGRDLKSPRTWAFAILGADALLSARPDHPLARGLLADFAGRLHALLVRTRAPGWCWFEPVLAYDNARLPEALARAGRRLGDSAMVADALAALAWLDRQQTNAAGQFRAVGTDSFGRPFADPLPFDQQPLEAWATVEAALFAATLDAPERWQAAAGRAAGWYLGENDLGLALGLAAEGGCFDGLMIDRANLNQGAESVLAYQFVCCAMRQLAEKTPAGWAGAAEAAAS